MAVGGITPDRPLFVRVTEGSPPPPWQKGPVWIPRTTFDRVGFVMLMLHPCFWFFGGV